MKGRRIVTHSNSSRVSREFPKAWSVRDGFPKDDCEHGKVYLIEQLLIKTISRDADL